MLNAQRAQHLNLRVRALFSGEFDQFGVGEEKTHGGMCENPFKFHISRKAGHEQNAIASQHGRF